MTHVRGVPCHPQTQGKIERWHQTLKNRILLENYYLPGDLEASIGRLVDYYNQQHYHESLKNLTPADVTLYRVRASCSNAKGSNERQSRTAACSTKRKPLKITNQMSQSLH
jgi:putative transposase